MRILLFLLLSFSVSAQDTLTQVDQSGEFITYTLDTDMYSTLFFYEQQNILNPGQYTYVGAGNALHYNPVHSDSLIKYKYDLSNLRYFNVDFAGHHIFTDQGKWTNGSNNTAYLEGYYESQVDSTIHIIPCLILRKTKE
jgi:hypothetical protein